MPRTLDAPIHVPEGVQVQIVKDSVSVKGQKGELNLCTHPLVAVRQEDQYLKIIPNQNTKEAVMHCGTAHSLVANMVQGVTEGFELKLLITGVGYRAQLQGRKLNLSLGYSHSVVYELPENVSAELPSQTEIVLRSAHKQQIGQVAAEIRGLRPLEPYKGKGIRYVDEQIRLKEAKKK